MENGKKESLKRKRFIQINETVAEELASLKLGTRTTYSVVLQTLIDHWKKTYGNKKISTAELTFEELKRIGEV